MTLRKENDRLLKKIWNRTHPSGNLPADADGRIWQGIQQKQLKRKKTRRLLAYSLAASLTGLILLGGIRFMRSGQPEVQNLAQHKTDLLPEKSAVLQESTPAGDVKLITLPDGTKVWLNANSAIDYPAMFAAHSREVTLTGEAFFDVTKDAKRPFIIRSGNINTTVLGTSFNIKAYPGGQTSVSVLTGKVKVTDLRGRKVFLTPGETASVNNGMEVASTIPVQKNIQWKNAIIDADNKTLQEVAVELQAIKGVKVEFKNPASAARKLAGNIDTRQPVEGIMKTISFVLDIGYTIKGNTIIIK